MSRGGKAAVGIGGVVVLGAVGVALYLLLRRSSSPFSPPPLVEYTPLAPPPLVEYTPFSPNISVSPIGVPCRSSAACGPGLVCINGECRPESEWLS